MGEKGNLRIDLNISLNKIGEKLGTRVEIKNLNSIKFLTIAIDYETKRQIEIHNNNKIVQETRLFDSKKNITKTMRSKEDAKDYRYFPEPDLPPIILQKEYIEKIKKTLPELPDKKINRFTKKYGLSMKDAKFLSLKKDTSEYFEETLKNNKYYKKDEKIISKITANWCISNIYSLLNKDNIDIKESKISPKNLSVIIEAIYNETLSNHTAKFDLQEVWTTRKDPKKL